MGDEIENSMKVPLMIISSLLYCYYIPRNLTKGTLRFFSLFPILSLFSILPLYLSSVFAIGITAVFITWLGNFKLLLFAFNQGPLISPTQNLSLAQFISIFCFPAKINKNEKHPFRENQKPLQVSLIWCFKFVLFAVLIGVLDYLLQHLHQKLVLFVYCLIVYLFVDIIFGITSVFVRLILGIELEPPSDEPYLATSLQDFWGKRWNLTVTNNLRHTVYKPVRVFSETYVGHQLAHLLAVLATFVVSGLMHELLFYYLTRANPTWEMASYFMLHGVCLVLEFLVKKAVAGRWRLPTTLSRLLTVSFAVMTAEWLFFPVIWKNGADARAIEEMKMFVNVVKERFMHVSYKFQLKM